VNYSFKHSSIIFGNVITSIHTGFPFSPGVPRSPGSPTIPCDREETVYKHQVRFLWHLHHFKKTTCFTAWDVNGLNLAGRPHKPGQNLYTNTELSFNIPPNHHIFSDGICKQLCWCLKIPCRLSHSSSNPKRSGIWSLWVSLKLCIPVF